MNSHLKKRGIKRKQKESSFLPVVFSAALVLLIVPVIVSAERHNSPGTVYSLTNASEPDGNEVPAYKNLNFNSSTAEIDPFQLVEELPFSSVLGDAVIVETHDQRNLLVVSINVILNDALVQGEEGGLQIAYDITDPDEPIETWRTPTIDVNPATGLRYNSGVSAGSSLAVDCTRGYLFGGTGQNTTEPYAGYPDPELASEGYVDRSDSLYAMEFNTGEFVWTNQFHVGDVFNLNAPVSKCSHIDVARPLPLALEETI